MAIYYILHAIQCNGVDLLILYVIELRGMATSENYCVQFVA